MTSDTDEIERNIELDTENIGEKIEILSNEDDRLKLIGEVLSNESSRNIFKLLISNELTAYEIVKKTNLSLSLVLHHINKMQSAGIVKISKISQTSRNQDMKHYTAKSGILIFPQTVSEKAKTSKSFQNSLKRIMKFSSIGLAGIVSWLFNSFLIDFAKTQDPLPPYLAPYEVPEQSQFLVSLVLPLVVVIIGLAMERIMSFRK